MSNNNSKIILVIILTFSVGLATLVAQNVLPLEKQVIEDLYAHERAAGAQNPAPRDPNAPYPSVPDRSLEVGILQDCDSFHSAIIKNCWAGVVNGKDTVVSAGVQPDFLDSQQGVVCIESECLLTPIRAGAVRIVGEQNLVLKLVSDTGFYVLFFDVRTKSFSSVIVDTTPPRISGMPNTCTIWPVDQKLKNIATITASDTIAGLDPNSFRVTVTSNEPIGRTDPKFPDIVIEGTSLTGFTIQLRADRLGSRDDRKYSIIAEARDYVGNTTTGRAVCTVPHDQSN